MHMEAVQKYVVNMTREEAIELRDFLGTIASGNLRGTKGHDLYLELVRMVGHKYDQELN